MAGDETETPGEAPVDLENQFILRLPAAPATALRAAIQSGVNLKDRLNIQVEQDMRHGKVRFDGWSLPGKMVDLPTVIESHKTLDRKNFYKTADICQIMLCKEDVEEDKSDDKHDDGKKKDGKDKKFQWLHGLTPPLKNARKKRFRKTLKKKFVDVPEIEKEVRLLFKTDISAVSVRYELGNADDEKPDARPGASGANVTNTNSQSLDIVEHDLFGGDVSSSDEEDTRIPESDDGSRMSASSKMPSQDDKFLSNMNTGADSKPLTEFPKGMLMSQSQENSMSFDIAAESTNAAAAVAALEEASATSSHNEALLSKLNDLREEIANLQTRRQAQEEEIASIENFALQQRFRTAINSLLEQEAEKRRQYEEISAMLES
ncbi:Transcription initiation factor TFIID subunit 7 [Halotydeus destructor]|nr:Transcription initiation factor TFIID subunit 7 [Halotydeus destructor]